MTQVTQQLGQRTATGMLWIAGQTIISRFTSFVTQLLLAWLLAREDFGLIALVNTIYALIRELTQPGVDDVLLQKHKRIRAWASPAFWLSLSCAVGGAVLAVLLAALVAQAARTWGNEAYANPKIFWMVVILALGGPLNAVGLVPMVMLRAQLRFARVAMVNLGEVVTQQALLILFAVLGFGAYSFVLPMPIVAAVRSAVLWWIVRPKVPRRLGLPRWPALIGSTGYVLGHRLLITATGQGQFMILGAIVASEDIVGQLFFAYMLATQVLRMLWENVGGVLLPAMNTIQDDAHRLGKAVERAGRLLSALVIPVVALQVLLAGPAVRVLFGEKWEPAVPLVQGLSLGALLLPASWPTGSMMMAQGRFRGLFWCWVFNAASFFAMVTPATWLWQARGTAVAVGFWQSWIAFWCAVVAYRSFWGGAGMVLGATKWPIVAALASAVAGMVVRQAVPETTGGDILSLAVASPVMVVIYLGVLRLLDRQTFQNVVDQLDMAVRPLLRKLRGSTGG